MKPSAEVVANFEKILAEVLARTKASRTTLRLDHGERKWHVDGVVAEALAPGVKSFKADSSLDQRRLSTVRFMEGERRILVQDDCLNCDPQPPPELLEFYGVKSQMLGPIVREAKLMGWVSVHDVRGSRKWQQHEIGALEEAVRQVHRQLDAMD